MLKIWSHRWMWSKESIELMGLPSLEAPDLEARYHRALQPSDAKISGRSDSWWDKDFSQIIGWAYLFGDTWRAVEWGQGNFENGESGLISLSIINHWWETFWQYSRSPGIDPKGCGLYTGIRNSGWCLSNLTKLKALAKNKIRDRERFSLSIAKAGSDRGRQFRFQKIIEIIHLQGPRPKSCVPIENLNFKSLKSTFEEGLFMPPRLALPGSDPEAPAPPKQEKKRKLAFEFKKADLQFQKLPQVFFSSARFGFLTGSVEYSLDAKTVINCRRTWVS